MLIAAAGRTRDVNAVWAAVQAMRSARVPPDTVTHGALVGALCRCGRLGDAEDALASARAIGGGGFGARPGVTAYTALVQGYAKAADFDSARRIMALMTSDDVPPNVVTFCTLLDGLVRRGRMADALSVIHNDMRSAGVAPNAVAFNTVLRGFCASGDVNSALQLLRDMDARRVRPSATTYNTLLAALLRAEDRGGEEAHAGGAAALLRRMAQDGVKADAATLTSLVASAGRRGDKAGAVAAYERIEAAPSLASSRAAAPASPDAPPPGPDATARAALVAALAFSSDFEGALRALADAEAACGTSGGPDSLKVSAYGGLVAALAAADDLGGAVGVYRRCVSRGVPPDAPLFDALICCAVRAERFGDAARLCGDMQAQGLNPDVRKYARMLRGVEKRHNAAWPLDAAERPRRAMADAAAPPSWAGGAEATVRGKAQPWGGEGFERFKWFLGMPSTYYNTR